MEASSILNQATMVGLINTQLPPLGTHLPFPLQTCCGQLREDTHYHFFANEIQVIVMKKMTGRASEKIQ
jgi:hypothetical protein